MTAPIWDNLAPEGYWQALLPPQAVGERFARGYPARLPDGRLLPLPIRALPGDPGQAVASLIVNQASFAVEEALTGFMVESARALHPEVVVGLPTLGLSLAPGLARGLGHSRYVPLGTSRKFWYEDALSVDLASITSPGAGKRLYLDPRMLPLLEGRRVLLVDDVVSTGRSACAALSLMRAVGIEPIGYAVAMRQTRRWADAVDKLIDGFSARVLGVIDTPLLVREGDFWRPLRLGEASPAS